jgi:gliding motility-associated lipoprotein GldH
MKASCFALAALVGIAAVFSACDESRVFEKNREIKDYIWDSRNKASFTFEVKDTATLHNIYVNVRHADFYQYSNIWLMVRTTFPDGKQLSKRVEVPLANDDGAWHGEGIGDIWDARHMIQQGAFFEQIHVRSRTQHAQRPVAGHHGHWPEGGKHRHSQTIKAIVVPILIALTSTKAFV